MRMLDGSRMIETLSMIQYHHSQFRVRIISFGKLEIVQYSLLHKSRSITGTSRKTLSGAAKKYVDGNSCI